MSSTFARIVKSQRLDQKDPKHRAFSSKNLLTLADRARRGKMEASRPHRRLLFMLRTLLRRLVRFVLRRVL